MARYHTEKQQKNSKTAKNTKLAECQALAQIRLLKKDVKTYKGLTGEIDYQIHQKKLFLVRNSTKNLDAWSKSGGKNSKAFRSGHSHAHQICVTRRNQSS